jgi:hypothetical protein
MSHRHPLCWHPLLGEYDPGPGAISRLTMAQHVEYLLQTLNPLPGEIAQETHREPED